MNRCLAIPVIAALVMVAFSGYLIHPTMDKTAPRGYLAASVLTRTGQINITSDANWSSYASSGSGSFFDPWVINEFLIEGNGSIGWGISVADTTDYAIFRDGYINETGSGLLDFGIGLVNSNHITLDNVTVESCGNLGLVLVNVTNVWIDSCSVNYNTNGNVYLEGSYNVQFINTNLIPVNTSISLLIGVAFTGNYSRHVRFDNCSLNSGGDSIVYGITDIVFNQTNIGQINLAQANDAILRNCHVDEYLQFINAHDLLIDGCTFNDTAGAGYNIFASGVLNATDVVIRNSSFVTPNTTAITVNPNVMMVNLTIIDCSFVEDTALDFYTALVSNVVLDNNLIGGSVMFDAVTNITVHGNIFNSTSLVGGLRLKNIVSPLIVNNTFITHATPITIDGCTTYQVINNTLTHPSNHTLVLTGFNSGGMIKGNHIRSQAMAGSIYFDLAANNDDVLIQDNIFDGVSLHDDAIAMVLYSGAVNITVIGNWFINVDYAFFMGFSTSITNVTGNFFDSVIAIINSNSSSLPVSMQRNYYRNYFTRFPYAITSNDIPTTGQVLQYPYNIRGALNDTQPLYYEPWFVINRIVYLQFDSVVNGAEVPLGYLRVYLDGTLITTLSPVVEHVLYNIVAYDLKGNLYTNRTYNMNATGQYLQIVLDVATQCFFSWFSNIDNFGLPFEIVKLFVNGSRVTTNAPTMLSEISRITIKDYANSILYDHVLNLSIVGIYLDLGLAIATITFSNEYNQTVIFYLIKGGVTVSFTIPRLSSITVRLAMGDYQYEITDLTGHQLESGDLTFDAGDSASFFVVFGKVSVTPPGGLPDATAQLLSVTLITVGVLGAVLVFATIVSRGSSGSGGSRPRPRPSKKSKKYKYVM